MRLQRAVPKLWRVYALGFALVLLQVGYWKLVRGPELATHPRNRRYWSAMDRARRGRILSAEGTELAVSVPLPGQSGSRAERVREYPGGARFGHLTGYTARKYGEAGVEAALRRALLGLDEPRPLPHGWLDLLLQLAGPAEPVGNDVMLTIDAELQREACAALGQRRGAIVAIEVSTGAVLAMADFPSYDPGTLTESWGRLNADADHPLLARASQGQYPPGSVFKVLTAMIALETGAATPQTTYLCEGTKRFAHSTVKCLKRSGHGRLTLAEGLAKSCNIALAEAALSCGAPHFEQYLGRVGLDQAPALFRPGHDRGEVARGSFPTGADLTPQQLAACGYGQGSLLVTPLWVASLGQTIGHGGIRLEPYLVQRISRPGGAVVFQHPDLAGQGVFSPQTAKSVLQMMRAVMQPGGTAAHLATRAVTTAGKTGSAENPHGAAHSWFLVLAPAESPRIAVAAAIENGGAGGRAAGPAAMKVARAGWRKAK